MRVGARIRQQTKARASGRKQRLPIECRYPEIVAIKMRELMIE